MYKDWKIGLATGMIVVLTAVVLLAIDPRLGLKARLSYNHNTAETKQQVAPFVTSEQLPNYETSYEPTPMDSHAKQEFISVQQPQSRHVTEKESILPQAKLAPLQNVSPFEGPDLTPYEKETIKTQKFHFVQKNQSLWIISSLYYGRADNWKKILEANRKVIKDPNKIAIGTKLIIPD